MRWPARQRSPRVFRITIRVMVSVFFGDRLAAGHEGMRGSSGVRRMPYRATVSTSTEQDATLLHLLWWGRRHQP